MPRTSATKAGGTSIGDGMALTLGTPTDTSFASGISGFTTSTKVTDAIDTLDETLSYLAPADASSLDGGTLTMSGTTKYSGYVSAGNTNYKTGEGAGTSVAYIINDPTFTLTTPSTSTTYNKADEGYTRWYKAVGTNAYSGTPEDSVDHVANFDEGNRSGNQTNTPWTDAQISVTSVGWYNSFPKWQKGNATLTITGTQLSQGYNRVKITREGSFTTQTSNDYEVFYDNDAGSNPSVNTPTIAENTPVSVYRSGVKYYGSGSTFNVSVTGSDCFDNTFVLNPIVLTSRDGASSSSWFSSTNVPYNDATVSGVSNPPAINDTMTVTNKVITSVASQRAANGRVRATPNDPFGSYTTADSASANRLVEGYANNASGTSSDTSEPFDDEWYRMLSNFNIDSTSYSSGATGGWDSTVSLVSGTTGYDGLETYQGVIKYPVTNYSSGYLPSSGQPNYSSASGNRVYIRYFYVGAGMQNFTWTVSGTSVTPVSVATGPSSNNLTFEMLAPATTKDGSSTTEWKDMYTAYTDDASDGCYVSGTRSSSTSNWVTTLGTKSTSTSGNVVCIRITAAAAWTGNLSTVSVSAS